MTSSSSHTVYDDTGNQVLIGKKLGSGGEGDVYEMSSTQVVAKIYHKSIDSEKQQKLKLMVQGCNDELNSISAWPSKLLFSRPNGPVCGFIMPRIADYQPIHNLYGPAHRKQLFPHADWMFLIRASKNLAASFAVIHKYGYVIGDVNEGNILVNKQACVKLIDCDSFQVRGSGTKVFCCEVGVPQFTPPELQNKKDFSLPRIPNCDNFGLGILIFQLLFMGRHPFSGVFHGKGDMPIEKAIAEFRFAFSRTSNLKMMSPPPNTVDLSILPADIGIFFERAFSESGIQKPFRPCAADWFKSLNDLENRLKVCNLEPLHKYYSGLSDCPWCKLESVSGILLFIAIDTTTKFDLKNEWQKVLAIKNPGPLPNIDPKLFIFPPEPIPAEIKKAVFHTKIRQIFGVIIIVLGLLVDLWLLIPCLILAAILFLYRGKEKKELNRRKEHFQVIRNNWNNLNENWRKEAGDVDFRSQYNHLVNLKRNYESLEHEYKNEYMSLQNTARERQLRKYLETCFIDNSNIPRIGRNRKATLRSFGIETAADIVGYKIRGIPGFGDVLTSELLYWRQQMENRFRFDPSKGVDKSDIQSLTQKFQPRMRPLERGLRAGIENLNRIQQKIFMKRISMQPDVEKSAKELAQAYANLKPFQIINF